MRLAMITLTKRQIAKALGPRLENREIYGVTNFLFQFLVQRFYTTKVPIVRKWKSLQAICNIKRKNKKRTKNIKKMEKLENVKIIIERRWSHKIKLA